jgi:ubiquinone/menaquinone biosynthesis C-methylase UbiE
MLTQDNQLFTCPAVKDKPLKRVLDAGCGTGIWSIDFGESDTLDHIEMLREAIC